MSYFDDVFEPSLLSFPRKIRANFMSERIRELRDGIWYSANGPMPMESMSDRHLRNALNMVTRRDRDEADRVAKEMLGLEIDRRRTKVDG